MSEKFDLNEATIRMLVEKTVAYFPALSLEELSPIVGRVIEHYLRERRILELRSEIVSVGRHFYDLGYLAGTSGNISVRLGKDEILITPSGMRKGDMVPEDILLVSSDGRLLETSSEKKPSSEMKMHLIAYKERPDVGAIVHAHPPFATGFATARLPLNMPVLPEAILVLGDIPLVEYATPSTWEVPERLQPHLQGHNVFLLANHGALTLGRDLNEASHRMETLELYARVILIARMLGGEKILSKEDLEKLRNAFQSSKT